MGHDQLTILIAAGALVASLASTVLFIYWMKERRAFSQRHSTLASQVESEKSARFTAQKELARFKDVLAVIEQGLAIGNPDATMFEWVNPAYARMHGYDSVLELIGQPVSIVYPADRGPELGESVRRSHHSGHYVFETVHQRKDGSTFPTLIDLSAIKDKDRNVLYCVSASIDITERKLAEEAMRKSEASFRFLANATPHIVWTTDPEGNVDWSNDRGREYFGFSIAEKDWKLALHPEDLDRAARRWQQAVDSGLDYEVEYRLKREVDGQFRWHMGRAIAMRNTSGDIEKWYGTCTDIHDKKLAQEAVERSQVELEKMVEERTAKLAATNTALEAEILERKRIEDELRGHEAKFRAVADTAHLAIITCDAEGHIVYSNGEAKELFGYSDFEMKGQPVTLILPTRHWAAHLRTLEEFLRNGVGKVVGKTVELTGRRKSGEDFPLELSLANWKSGDDVFFTGILKDITDRKWAESRLQASEQQYRFLADSIPNVVWTATPDGQNDYLNMRWTDYTGMSVEESTGEGWIKAIHPDDLSRAVEDWRAAMVSGDPLNMDMRMRGKAGAYRWHTTVGLPMHDPDGTIVKWVGTLTDVDNKIEYEEGLRSATLAKSQFLANMSHEIRTPLTSIIGFSESLLGDSMSHTDRREALETVLRNGRHLLGIINDILDLSKIEAGKLETEMLSTSVFDLVSDVGNLVRHKADEQGIAFRLDYEYPLPERIHTDPTRLKQILFNLLGNAVKFTRKGTVSLKLGFDPGGTQLRFDVTDTGIGLSEEQQGRLFKAFSQADTSTTRRFGGTGLGLVISSQLASLLGGTIEVSSTPGQGSTFSLMVNTGEIEQDVLTYSEPKSRRAVHVQKAPEAQLSGKVLLAEDGRDNRILISFLLKKTGIEATIVENGALAVEAAKREDFDLILMDMQMPVMDGPTATRELRRSGYDKPIIALTANTMMSDIEHSIAIGCNAHLGKPFNRREFFNLLKQYLKPKVEEETSA